MKRNRRLQAESGRAKKGFSFLEILVISGIISGLFVGTYSYMTSTQTGVRVSTAVQDIQAIRAAANNWGAGRLNYYSGVSMSKLSHLLPEKLASSGGAGVKANPWQGDYSVAAKSGDDTTFVITASGVPEDVNSALLDRLNGGGKTVAAFVAGSKGKGELSVTYE